MPAAIGAAGESQAAAEWALGEAQLCFHSLAFGNELCHLEFFLAGVKRKLSRISRNSLTCRACSSSVWAWWS